MLLHTASRRKFFGRRVDLKDAAGSTVATLDPQAWKSDPTWLISSSGIEYAIKRKKKSFERSYWIEGGPFSGAVIEGGYFDTKFRIRLSDHIIASATENDAFSLTALHTVDVFDTSESAQILTACVGVMVVKEKQQAQANQQAR